MLMSNSSGGHFHVYFRRERKKLWVMLIMTLPAKDYVPALIDAGVGCFKIEGRLKGEESNQFTRVKVCWIAPSTQCEVFQCQGTGKSARKRVLEVWAEQFQVSPFSQVSQLGKL